MFDKDLFLFICEKYDVEFSQTADSPMLREGRTMIKTIEVETDDDFKGCDDCVHDDDTREICKMRGCIHAILDDEFKECYQPKLSTKRRKGKR